MGDHYFNRSPSYYKLIKCSIRLLHIISSMYLPFIWHADKVYLQRYQNMCYDVIYHCEIEQIFPPVAYIILRGKPAATEAKINNRCGKEKFTIFGLQPANIWGWNQRWHWFMELSFLIVTWFLQFFSVIEFKKTGICSVSRIFMRKRLKEKIDASKYTTILGSKKSIYTMY